MVTQRYCKLCRETFEIERKVGHPREYCLECEPEGYSVVTTRSGRRKLRRRVPLVKMSDLYLWGRS